MPLPMLVGTGRTLLSRPAFNPLQLSPALWLDAERGALASGGGAAVADDPIETWQDQSGNGRHATQATAAKRPLYKLAVLNGKPGLRFDAVDDWLRSSLLLGTGAAGAGNNHTIFVVAKANGTTQAIVSQTSGNVILLHWHAAFYDSGTTSILTSVCNGVFGIAALVNDYGAGQFKVYDNGVLDGSASNAGRFISASTFLIGAYLETARFLNGDVCEVIVYQRVLADAERQQVERYLRAKWATP